MSLDLQLRLDQHVSEEEIHTTLTEFGFDQKKTTDYCNRQVEFNSF